MLKLAVAALTQTATIVSGRIAQPVFRAYTGNDLVLHFTVVDDAGDPVDISGWTTRNFALYTMDSGTAVFTKTPAFVTDGTDGEFTVTITDSDTSSLDAGNHRIEVQATGSGIKTTPVRGIIAFSKTYS